MTSPDHPPPRIIGVDPAVPGADSTIYSIRVPEGHTVVVLSPKRRRRYERLLENHPRLPASVAYELRRLARPGKIFSGQQPRTRGGDYEWREDCRGDKDAR